MYRPIAKTRLQLDAQFDRLLVLTDRTAPRSEALRDLLALYGCVKDDPDFDLMALTHTLDNAERDIRNGATTLTLSTRPAQRLMASIKRDLESKLPRKFSD